MNERTPTVKDLRQELLKVYLNNVMPAVAHDLMGMTILQYIFECNKTLNKPELYVSQDVMDKEMMRDSNSIDILKSHAYKLNLQAVLNDDVECIKLVDYFKFYLIKMIDGCLHSIIPGSVKLIISYDCDKMFLSLMVRSNYESQCINVWR